MTIILLQYIAHYIIPPIFHFSSYYIPPSSGCEVVFNHRVKATTVILPCPALLAPKADNSICLVFSSIIQLSNLDVRSIVSSLTFDNIFHHSKRQTAFFGASSYNYSNTHHIPSPLSTNKVVQNCLSIINDTFPNAGLNSVLINYYPDAKAMIPFHSDDEADIYNDSYIFTLSIGALREMTFRNKRSKKHLLKLALPHGSLICFSKYSQSLFEHAILELEDDRRGPTGPRISFTFRKIH